MIARLFLLACGIYSHAFLPRLPPLSWTLATLAVLVVLAIYTKARHCLLALVAGLVLGVLWGHLQMAHRLSADLDKTDLVIVGRVVSLVSGQDARRLFVFDVDAIESASAKTIPNLQRLRLSWYEETAIAPGERWRLSVRLRSPRGFANPGSFDYGAWLMAEGISATGYVRANSANRRLAEPEPYSILAFRDRLRQRLLEGTDSPVARGFLAALTLGDKSLIPASAYRDLVATGTVHLMVVSGLHVGMVAAFGFMLGYFPGRFMVALGAPWPARFVGAIVAGVAIFAYSAVAGFALPAVRALVMAGIALVAVLLRRQVSPWLIFAYALLGVALIDPLAATRPGFWLSFCAVAGLVGWFGPRTIDGRWRQLLLAQGVVFAVLAPWLTFFQGSPSWMALPVNLIVIPWISVAVVPFCLLGALAYPWPTLGNFLWDIAAVQLDVFGGAIQWLSAGRPAAADSLLLDMPRGWLRRSDLWLLLAMVALSVMLLLPRGVSKFIPVSVLAAAILTSRLPAPSVLAVTVLDVGQGLAVVVRTARKTLVFDTGTGFPSGFNIGEAVIAPFLSSLGVDHIDTLVVSHGDQDHSGGTIGLLSQVPVGEILSGQPVVLRPPPDTSVRRCEAGQGWLWDGVRFEFLWPERGEPGGVIPANDNNHSCVLLVSAGNRRVLIPGDIEASVERRLADPDASPGIGELDVVVAPHHGSKTSSSADFVAAARPRHVVFSAGFNHHFGHPHPKVVERYSVLGATRWRTSASGALTFSWSESGELEVSEYRRLYRRYWNPPLVPPRER